MGGDVEFSFDKIYPYEPNTFPDFFAKYASVRVCKERGCAIVNDLIDRAPVTGTRRHTLVDVKTQVLHRGEVTCMPGFHKDLPQDPDSLHHLFIIGYQRTEFLAESGEVVELPHGCWGSYGPETPHRGPLVHMSMPRLLVRVSESNIVPPSTNLRACYSNRYHPDASYK